MRFVSLLSLMAVLGVSARAATFTIDPAQSTVTLSGSVSGFALREQGPGSLATRLEGALEVQTTGSEISLPSGQVDARTNGVWAPFPGGAAGVAAADFGARASAPPFAEVIGALRNIVMEVSGGARPLQGTQFNASGLVFSFPTNSLAALDFDAGVIGKGSRALAAEATNNAATTGTITGVAGSRVLTINVAATFVFSVFLEEDSPLTVTGKIVANEGGPAPAGPRITDIEVIGAEVKVTADGTTAATKLLASANLTGWAEKAATVTTVDADTRVYTAPRVLAAEFYQLQQ